MTQGRHSRRIPENVKFYIWPTYYLEVDGIGVYPTKTQGEILLFLMSEPGRRFTAKEIGSRIYADRADGGPLAVDTCIGVQIVRIHLLCQRAGIDLRLKMGSTYLGYTFIGASLTDKGHAELDRRAAIPAAVPARKPDPRKAPKEHREKDRTLYRFTDTKGWTFPERHEYRERYRAKSVDVIVLE